MSVKQYAILIDAAGVLAGLLVLLPVLLFMFTGWVIRRDKLISYLEEDTLKVYYEHSGPVHNKQISRSDSKSSSIISMAAVTILFLWLCYLSSPRVSCGRWYAQLRV